MDLRQKAKISSSVTTRFQPLNSSQMQVKASDIALITQPAGKPSHTPVELGQKTKVDQSSFPSETQWRANDFYRALGMARNEFCHTTEQEALDASWPMRANYDQIGTPLCCRIDDRLSNVTYLSTAVSTLNPALCNSFAMRSPNSRAGFF
jgi:hypothetical protein